MMRFLKWLIRNCLLLGLCYILYGIFGLLWTIIIFVIGTIISGIVKGQMEINQEKREKIEKESKNDHMRLP